MFELTEEDITNAWPKNEPIHVSICCITYRQEQYIAQAIDSFLMQKTTFPFEIIIGEDNGCDGTLAILAEYQKRYPKIIKVLTSENNLGINANFLRVFNAAQGEYIAVCEGDDYWIDINKIQSQVIAMNDNPECNICITKAISLHPDSSTSNFCDLGNKSKILPFDFCILGPKKDFFPTATFFIRKDILDTLPSWYAIAPVGDYYLQLWAAKYNGCVYLPTATAVYRRSATGSWSSNLTKEKMLLDSKRRVCISIKLKEDIGEEYHSVLSKRLGDKYLLGILVNINGRLLKKEELHLLISAIKAYPSSIIHLLNTVFKRIFHKVLSLFMSW